MKILLLDGGKAFGHSGGRLNHTLHQTAKETLTANGPVIWQMPGWWMHEPWMVKKYMDEIFTTGHGKLYQSDGRHRVNPSEGYGTGGLLQGRKHMLSLTWNAPIEAFTRAGDFFGGVGVDGVYLHFHKANEFIGLAPLPTFLCNDVIKNPQVEKHIADYRAHLQRVFG